MSALRPEASPGQHQEMADDMLAAGVADGSRIAVPDGVMPREARLLLRMFARLKEKRFGRLSLTLADARLVEVELVERVDREILRRLQPRDPRE
jgi:hypothetical protein